MNMPAGHTKFNEIWLEHIDSNGKSLSVLFKKERMIFMPIVNFATVILSVTTLESSSFCNMQNTSKLSNTCWMISKLKLHVCSRPSSSSNSSSSSNTHKLEKINYSNFIHSNVSLEAQIYWISRIAICNFSLCACDHILV